jgi:hypothetical protein
MMQEYICPACCYAGAVVIRDHADVYEVLNQLEDDHKEHSPDCAASRLGMRVRNPELCNPEEWEFLKISIRDERDLRQERDS